MLIATNLTRIVRFGRFCRSLAVFSISFLVPDDLILAPSILILLVVFNVFEVSDFEIAINATSLSLKTVSVLLTASEFTVILFL